MLMQLMNQYHTYTMSTFNTPHSLHLKLHLPVLLGSLVLVQQDLHEPQKIHLQIKMILKFKCQLVGSSDVLEQIIVWTK